MNLRIGFLTPTVGTFGAIREMVEISNVLVDRGHSVTIYHPDGKPCVWLPCRAGYGTIAEIPTAQLDVLIGIIDWQPDLYSLMLASPAKVNAVCLMGFAPSDEMAAGLRGESKPRDRAERVLVDAMRQGMTILADSSWQTEWFRQATGYGLIGPAFGGINLVQFHPAPKTPRTKLRVIASGDPRERKGGDTMTAAMEMIRAAMGDKVETDTYWNRRFTQAQLVEFLQQGDVFLDGHRRAGWCNPVAEAMACGTTVVCTDIGAVRDFALRGWSAMVVPVDDPGAMADAALYALGNEGVRQRLASNGLAQIAKFDYQTVAVELETYLLGRMAGG